MAPYTKRRKRKKGRKNISVSTTYIVSPAITLTECPKVTNVLGMTVKIDCQREKSLRD
jgi:hypothetical protein